MSANVRFTRVVLLTITVIIIIIITVIVAHISTLHNLEILLVQRCDGLVQDHLTDLQTVVLFRQLCQLLLPFEELILLLVSVKFASDNVFSTNTAFLRTRCSLQKNEMDKSKYMFECKNLFIAMGMGIYLLLYFLPHHQFLSGHRCLFQCQKSGATSHRPHWES